VRRVDVEPARDHAEAILIVGRYWFIALLSHFGLSRPCTPHIAQVACTPGYMACKGPEPTAKFVHVFSYHAVRAGCIQSWQHAHEVPCRLAPLPPHWVVNIMCPHVGIGLGIFWLSAAAGIFGVTVIHTTIGGTVDC
jgi:hypothetical protein